MNLAVFKKEIGDLINERTFLSTILLQVFLIVFYSIAILGLLVIFNPQTQTTRNIDILIVDNEHIDMDFTRLLQKYRTTVGDIRDYADYDLIIEFRSREPIIMYVYTFERSFKTAFALTELKKVLLTYEEDVKAEIYPIVRVNPILRKTGLDQNTLTVTSLIFEFKYFLLVPLLLFLPIYLSGVLFIDLFTEEISKKTLSILLVAPIKIGNVIFQKILAALVLSFAQIIAWIAILEFRNIPINNVGTVLLLLLFTNISVLLLSAIIATTFRTRALSQMAFSFAMIVLLVSKSYAYNPLNIVTRLAVIDVILGTVIAFVTGLMTCSALLMLVLFVRIRYFS